MNEARRSGTCARTKIAFVNDKAAYALFAQIAIKARAIDACTQNEHINTVGFELVDTALHLATAYEIVHFTVFTSSSRKRARHISIC